MADARRVLLAADGGPEIGLGHFRRCMALAAAFRHIGVWAGAVSAGGQTLYELAWAGCPTIAFETVENQASHLEAMAVAGVVRSVGAISLPGFLCRIRSHIEALLGDPGARQAMSAAGRHLIDGRGALRMARKLMGL